MEIKVKSYVKFINENNEEVLAVVRFKVGDKYIIQEVEGELVREPFSESELVLVPPIIVDSEYVLNYVRYENNTNIFPILNYEIKKGIKRDFSISDFFVGLQNILKDFDHFNEWITFLKDVIYLNKDGDFDDSFSFDSSSIVKGFPNDNNLMYNILNFLTERESGKIEVEHCINRISTYLNNKGKKIEDWELSIHEKKTFIAEWDNDNLDLAPEDVVNLLRKYCLELADKNEEVALKCLAYSYYSGNRLCERDNYKSRDYLLRLLPFDKNGFYANTLAYIYYYGRCNNKVPQYEEAFKYYSIGHLYGIYESTYKLADMFLNGYWVRKDVFKAFDLVSDVFYYNMRHLQEGGGLKIADAALRMGNLELNTELRPNTSYEKAYFYYLIADYSIKERMRNNDFFGDKKVYNAIQKCLEETYPKTRFCSDKKIMPDEIFPLFEPMFADNAEIYAKISKCKKGYKITFKNNDEDEKLFTIIPEISYCGRRESLELIIEGFNDEILNGEEEVEFVFDGFCEGVFCYNNEPILPIECDYYIVSESLAEIEKEYLIATCCYSLSGREYDFICDNDKLKVGDFVTVKSPDGLAEVIITKLRMKKESELILPVKKYKHIK